MRGLFLSAVWGLALALATADPPSAEQQQGDAEGPILGAPSAFDLEARPEERIRLPAETALYQQPAPRSPVLTRLDFTSELAVVERREGWIRVRYGAVLGWVTLAPEAAESAPAAPWKPDPGGPDFGGPDPALLERARRHLKASAIQGSLGPYVLYTDVNDEDLLAHLSRLAAQLPELFRQRFGLAAQVGADEAVVIYQHEESYQAYLVEEDPTLLDSSGRAALGLAVLYLGDAQRAEVRSRLVHEIVHLLSYRVLGTGLPLWLSEGMAEDLAYCRVSPAGELLPGTLDRWQSSRRVGLVAPGGEMRFGVERSEGGPQLRLAQLRDSWQDPQRPSLLTLLRLSKGSFMESEQRSLHYSMSAFWVRYLLAGERADALRSFLRGVADGERDDAETLSRYLGTPRSDLEAGWQRWLHSREPFKAPARNRGKSGR